MSPDRPEGGKDLWILGRLSVQLSAVWPLVYTFFKILLSLPPSLSRSLCAPSLALQVDNSKLTVGRSLRRASAPIGCRVALPRVMRAGWMWKNAGPTAHLPRAGERKSAATRAHPATARTAACPPRSPTAPARRSRPSTTTPRVCCTEATSKRWSTERLMSTAAKVSHLCLSYLTDAGPIHYDFTQSRGHMSYSFTAHTEKK